MNRQNNPGNLGWIINAVKNVGSIAVSAKALVPVGLLALLTSWGTWAAGVFAQYAPLSWILAGISSFAILLIITAFCYWLWQVGLEKRVRARFDALALDRGSSVNP